METSVDALTVGVSRLTAVRISLQRILGEPENHGLFNRSKKAADDRRHGYQIWRWRKIRDLVLLGRWPSRQGLPAASSVHESNDGKKGDDAVNVIS